MFIAYPNLVDCTVASALIFRAFIEGKATAWDTVQGSVVAPGSIAADDRYAYRLMPRATRGGLPVANPETDGPTLGWALPAHDAGGSWFVPWPDWGNAALQSVMPLGFSLVVSVNPDGAAAVLVQGQLNQIKVALYGNAGKNCAIFENGWCAVTPLPRHGDLARARGGHEVGAVQAQMWVAPEDAGETFGVGAQVMHNGEVWESLVPSNAEEPGTKGWVKI